MDVGHGDLVDDVVKDMVGTSAYAMPLHLGGRNARRNRDDLLARVVHGFLGEQTMLRVSEQDGVMRTWTEGENRPWGVGPATWWMIASLTCVATVSKSTPCKRARACES